MPIATTVRLLTPPPRPSYSVSRLFHWLMALLAWASLNVSVASGAEVRRMDSPAPPGSRVPDLTVLPDDRLLMSWMEPSADSGMALRCATFDGRKWAAPSTIAEGDSFFVNWADFASVRHAGGGRLAAHWLWRSGSGPYAYDVRISQSADDGRRWGPPITPHHDGTQSEHGFVSLVAGTDGLHAVWLDGRHTTAEPGGSHESHASMTLRCARIAPDGSLHEESELDSRTCDCCQTAAVITDRGLLVAYRDRSEDEVRDIRVVRGQAGRWTESRLVHEDGWHIPGCPVNGPALAARGSQVAIVWYTGARDTPRVHLAFSEDAGDSFGPPIRLDDGDPLGRVHITMLDDASVVATWVESAGREALIRARRVTPAGAGPSLTVARTSQARASGFPRVAAHRGALVFAWTEAGQTPRIRMATLESRRLRAEAAGGRP